MPLNPYNQPIAPVGAHPGIQLNRGWGWNWTGRERGTGRLRTYYTRTSYGAKGELADYVAHMFPGIEFIDAGPADREPSIVFPLPPESFQRGILENIKRELGTVPTRSLLRTLPRVRLLNRSWAPSPRGRCSGLFPACVS